MVVVNVIFSEFVLSYFGFGVVLLMLLWGNMMDVVNSLIDFQCCFWLWMLLGIVIFIIVIVINVLGDGLCDVMDFNMKLRLK